MPIKTFLLCSAIFILSACAKKSTTYYLLPVVPPEPSEIITPIADQGIYAMRYVTIPDYLTNRYILFFNTDGSVNRDPNRRWVDYPEDNIKRLLALHISKRLNSQEFYSYPLAQNIRPDRIIDISIIEMIGYAENQRFQAAATWQIHDKDGNRLALHQFNREYSLENTAGNTLAKTYQKALEALSTAIAQSLAKNKN